jgi:hypothetical protein
LSPTGHEHQVVKSVKIMDWREQQRVC